MTNVVCAVVSTKLGLKKKGPRGFAARCGTSDCVYCSPAVTLLPQRTLLPHRTLLPQSTLLPHNTLLPVGLPDPQRTLDPQGSPLAPQSGLPDIAEAGAPTRNCCDPHTAVFDHVLDVFHTAVELSLR